MTGKSLRVSETLLKSRRTVCRPLGPCLYAVQYLLSCGRTARELRLLDEYMVAAHLQRSLETDKYTDVWQQGLRNYLQLEAASLRLHLDLS